MPRTSSASANRTLHVTPLARARSDPAVRYVRRKADASHRGPVLSRSPAGPRAVPPRTRRSQTATASLSSGTRAVQRLRLLSIAPSPLAHKKMVATFLLDGPGARTKTTHFGAAGYEDFTTHGDEHRKRRYLARHQAREDFDSPTSAGALARWILWNRRTLVASIADYRKRFGV